MSNQELLWKYAEGEYTPEEKAAVEALLAGNETLREEFEMIQEMQATLASMEPQQPSMRFTQNVMEALPKIYSPAAEEPLVMPVWKKIFWGAVAATFGGVLIFGKFSGVRHAPAQPYVNDFNRELDAILNIVPNDLVTYFVMLLLVAGTLTIIDKALIFNKLKAKKH